MQKRQLIINNYKTAEDGLFTLSACTITKASQEQSFVKVPGRFAPLDLSTVLTDGQPYYGNAKLKATLESSEGTREERQTRIEHMKNLLDGYTAKIVHPDFPGKHLIGRVEVNTDFNGLANCAVKVTATLEPWLYNDEETEVKATVPHYVAGKNLLTYPYYNTSNEKNGVKWTDNGDGSITFEGTPTAAYTAGFVLSKDASLFKDGYTYTLSAGNVLDCYIQYNDESGTAFFVRNVTWKHGYTLTGIYLQAPKIQEYNGVAYPQLEIGATATEWKPYINAGGNNLLDIPDTTVSGSHAYSNVEVGDFELAPGDYTLSAQYVHQGPRAGQISVREYGTLDGYLNTATLQPGTSGKAVIRFTVPAGTKGIRIYLYSNVSASAGNTSVTISDVMVDKGSTALEYEPYYPLGSQLLTLTNEGRLAVVPVVDVVGSVSLTFDDKTHALSDGVYQLPDLYLTPGKHFVAVSGDGTATITYREAVLAG